MADLHFNFTPRTRRDHFLNGVYLTGAGLGAVPALPVVVWRWAVASKPNRRMREVAVSHHELQARAAGLSSPLAPGARLCGRRVEGVAA